MLTLYNIKQLAIYVKCRILLVVTSIIMHNATVNFEDISEDYYVLLELESVFTSLQAKNCIEICYFVVK